MRRGTRTDCTRSHSAPLYRCTAASLDTELLMKYTPQRIAPYALLCALSLGLVEPASAQIAPTVAFAAGTVSALASADAALVTVNRTGDASGAVPVQRMRRRRPDHPPWSSPPRDSLRRQ